MAKLKDVNGTLLRDLKSDIFNVKEKLLRISQMLKLLFRKCRTVKSCKMFVVFTLQYKFNFEDVRQTDKDG